MGEKSKNLEIWADSFHEGQWLIELIRNRPGSAFKFLSLEYLNDFVPQYAFKLADFSVNFTVFGGYSNWGEIPDIISNLLQSGKPDILLYDREADKIIFAIEETAAVPTGNQSLQRCERVVGSALLGVPFAYLVSRCGVHTDGRIRTTSIWPLLLALKLSLQYRVSSLSFLYSDLAHPEDYHYGNGVNQLASYADFMLKKHLQVFSKSDEQQFQAILIDVIKDMWEFIESQAEKQLPYMPSEKNFKFEEFTQNFLKFVLGKGTENKYPNFMVWPKANDREISTKIKDIKLGYINPDSFLIELDKLVKNKEGYVISMGVGSKPQSNEKIQDWLKALEIRNKKFSDPVYDYPINTFTFSKTSNDNYHVTTSKNITYLIDSLSLVEKAFKKSFTNRKSDLKKILKEFGDKPVFVYVINSLKPNRVFGDPFIGQFVTFANLFSYNSSNEKNRISLVYMPYQPPTIFFNSSKSLIKNKGIFAYRKFSDAVITCSGYIVKFKDGGKIHG